MGVSRYTCYTLELEIKWRNAESGLRHEHQQKATQAGIHMHRNFVPLAQRCNARNVINYAMRV